MAGGLLGVLLRGPFHYNLAPMAGFTFRCRAAILSLALSLSGLASAGCVDRLLQIRSNPSNASVYLNNDLIGTTPIDHRFDYYGTFEVTLRSDRSFSVHRLEKISPPWYEFFPFDIFAENLLPWRIRDHRKLHYSLEPAPPLKEEEIDRTTKAVLGRLQALEARLQPPAPSSP
jgi:hypothetical protein